MKKLRRNFERFCYKHRNKGISNLMLYIGLGNVILFFFAASDPSGKLVEALSFNRDAIFHGQVWRLFTYIFDPSSMGFFYIIMLFFYYQIGRMMEQHWGVLRFNLYYLSGIVITAIAGLALNVPATAYFLNISLLLAFATLCPEDQVLIFFIIPLKMKWLAWIYFGMTIYDMIREPFPWNLFPLFALLNYFLFFGSDIKHVLPQSRYRHVRKPHEKKDNPHAAPNPKWADGYRNAKGQKPYRHKCTVCGRTDTEFPELEFRYCSRCTGYYCYCTEHINNHEHIQG